MMLSESECLARASLPSQSSLCDASSPKGGALGKASAEGFFFPSDMLYYNVF